MNKKLLGSEILTSDTAIIIYLALFKLLIHLCTNAFAGYGIFRDELYYLACSHHLDIGYVDQPPLSIYILKMSLLLFGNSLFALRLLPAVAGALTVLITGFMVRKLGGGNLAMFTACMAVIAAPIFLGMNTVYSMNCFDILFWILAAYVLILIIKENNSKKWIVLGLVIGLGLLNKIGMIWFTFGLFIAIVLTNQRKHLSTKWPYLAALIAFLLFLPYIIWNFMHDFAHLEFIRNATTGKYASLTPVDFILGQLMILNPITSPVWLAGLYYYFFSKKGKSFMLLGIIYVTAFLILLINGHSKPEYLSPSYPMLFAAGAIQIEKLSQKKHWMWLKYALTVMLVIGGIITAPLVLPFLPVKTYIQYAEQIGIGPGSYEAKELTELHQFYADMHGWEKMVETVAGVYQNLPSEEQSQCNIITGNYGEAGAIDFFGRKYHLPKASSGHNNYWLWGPQNDTAQVVIHLGGPSEETLVELYREVQAADTFRCEYCMPYENNMVIYLCKEPRFSLKQIWPRMKHYE
jgi:hypothetical protein